MVVLRAVRLLHRSSHSALGPTTSGLLRESNSQPLKYQHHAQQTELTLRTSRRLYSTDKKNPSTHRLLLLQPRPKHATQDWLTLQRQEADALVNTLPGWSVEREQVLQLRDQQRWFGSGQLAQLRKDLRGDASVSAVFVNVSQMTGEQLGDLWNYWRVPVYDRYNIVLHIFRHYGKTEEARLQIALAELYYLKTRVREAHKTHAPQLSYDNISGMEYAGGAGADYWQKRKEILSERERELRNRLEILRVRRTKQRVAIQRERRVPVVAVVGYTNAGKTSLIKRLTQDALLLPENRLFATLDVTSHEGRLKATSLPVLYTDTVGFIQNIPTELLASFTATLDDIRHADVIVHVLDISHPDATQQRETVLKTLRGMQVPGALLSGIIEVCNKIDKLSIDDLVNRLPSTGVCLISCETTDGISQLCDIIEQRVMSVCDLRVYRLRLDPGSEELRYLYRERAVCQVEADGEEKVHVRACLSPNAFRKFRARYSGDSVLIDC